MCWSDRVFAESEYGDDAGPSESTEGDYDNKSPKKQGPSINIPLGPIIELLPPLIQQQQRPDLRFRESTARFDEATRRVAVSFCLINGGNGASKETKVVIRDGAGSQAIGNYPIEPLSPGRYACREDIWTSVPAGFTGARRYELVADPNKVIRETREDNNTAVATVEIRPLSDLTIAGFSAKFDATARRVALPLCIVNLGKSAVDRAELSIRDASTGDIVANTSIGPFPAGGRLCRTDLSTTLPAAFNGRRVYDAIVDPGNRIAESNEDNNTATAAASISALPDLAIADAAVRIDEATRQAVLSFCVVNRGKVAVKQSNISIRDRAAGGTVADSTMGPIAPGARACRKDVPAAVPAGFAGTRKYQLVVDPQGRVAEADEGNNTVSVTLKIQAQKPDLAFANSSARFDEATRRLTISFCVVNRGTGSAGDSDVTIRDRLSAEVIANPSVGPLQAGGQTCSDDLPASMPAGFSGTRQYDLVADEKGLIAESDERNNAASVTADVNGQPDLSFTDAAAKFDEAAREMVLSFCVINRGKALSDETRVSIRDPATDAEVRNPRIAPLASDQRTCRDGLLLPVASGFSGKQRYELSVDPDGKVSESDETNNTAQAETYVSALPNLTFADSSIRFDEATRRAMLSFCVVNRGQASSNEAAVSIRDSSNVVGNLKVGALSASNQACFNDVAMPTLEDHAGTRSYELIADADNATNELDENDNTRTVSVAVPQLPAPADYVTAAGPASEPASEPAHMSLALFVVAIVGAGALSGGIVFLLVRPRARKRTGHLPTESIQFRGRPDPGTQITHSASAQIVLPRLQLRGRADPGHQQVEMHEIAMRIAGE